jgi:hypothetical protein
MPTLKTYTSYLKTRVQCAHNSLPPAATMARRVDLSARCAGSGTHAGRMRIAVNRVTFTTSPGDFPRGRPAL